MHVRYESRLLVELATDTEWRPPREMTRRERIRDTWRFWDQYYVPARCAYCRLPGHVMADDRLHEWCWLELK